MDCPTPAGKSTFLVDQGESHTCMQPKTPSFLPSHNNTHPPATMLGPANTKGATAAPSIPQKSIKSKFLPFRIISRLHAHEGGDSDGAPPTPAAAEPRAAAPAQQVMHFRLGLHSGAVAPRPTHRAAPRSKPQQWWVREWSVSRYGGRGSRSRCTMPRAWRTPRKPPTRVILCFAALQHQTLPLEQPAGESNEPPPKHRQRPPGDR